MGRPVAAVKPKIAEVRENLPERLDGPAAGRLDNGRQPEQRRREDGGETAETAAGHLDNGAITSIMEALQDCS